jgi:hypothetical protein
LEGEACAVGWATERGIELKCTRLDDAQTGIGGNLDESLGGSFGISEQGVDVEKRKNECVELRRDVLLRRVHLVDLQEILD